MGPPTGCRPLGKGRACYAVKSAALLRSELCKQGEDAEEEQLCREKRPQGALSLASSATTRAPYEVTPGTGDEGRETRETVRGSQLN